MSEQESSLRCDYVPGCGYKIWQDAKEFCYTTDAVFLGNFPHVVRKAKVLELEGREVAGTFAFGDSENDLPMFDAVETKVAMGNAMPVLKERADYVTDHVKDDGVVHALRHFGLI